MKYNTLIPELIVSNFNDSIKFYVEKLGFSIGYKRKNPEVVFLILGEAQLLIQGIEDENIWEIKRPRYPFGRGVNFQITVKNVDEILVKIKKSKINIIAGPDLNKYVAYGQTIKQIEIIVSDPDGYILRFSQIVERGLHDKCK